MFTVFSVQYFSLVYQINSFKVYINSVVKMLNETKDCQNCTQNFIYPPFEWNLERSIKSVIFGSIVVGTVVGNFLVLFAFLRYRKQLRQPTHYFLANLSLADFLVGVGSLPFLAVRSVTER